MTPAGDELPASHLDLLEGEHTAVLTTIGPSGRPQSSAVFYLLEDGAVAISTRATTQKHRNLQRNPACTFFVLDPANTQRYLELRADAELAPDPDYELRDAIVAKYHMAPIVEPPGTERVAVRLRPVRVRTLDRPALRRHS